MLPVAESEVKIGAEGGVTSFAYSEVLILPRLGIKIEFVSEVDPEAKTLLGIDSNASTIAAGVDSESEATSRLDPEVEIMSNVDSARTRSILM